MRILGIETSCDETAAAIVQDGRKILTNVVASSAEMHQKYGGIVPEVAARKQVEAMIPVLTEAMNGFTKDNIDAIAVTIGPGLIGSLLVGVETAKTLAFAWNKPIIPVNHVLAHIYAVFLEENGIYSSSEGAQATESRSDLKNIKNKVSSRLSASWRIRSNNRIEFPAIALVVSGGHTELYLMENEKKLKWLGGTLDDAAGECFDKTARLLGLHYPGGPAIQTLAQTYNLQLFEPERPQSRRPTTYNLKLPRPMIRDESLNFSFSGLKTAVLREFNKLRTMNQWNNETVNQFAHEIQEAITDVLVVKTLKAAQIYHVKSIIVTGGVAANQRLREKFTVHSSQFTVAVPSPELCVDSASYIAAYAYFHNQPVNWKTVTAQPDLSV